MENKHKLVCIYVLILRHTWTHEYRYEDDGLYNYEIVELAAAKKG